MYGMVNKALRGLVLERFGQETWEVVREKAGAPGDFESFRAYDDAITYGLVGAAVGVLEVSAEKLLHDFGRYWILNVAAISYADLMSKVGRDFPSFLQGLDQMHSRMMVTFPGYSPPSFRVEVRSESSLQLDYYSEREGLVHFVEGLLHGLGGHFGQKIRVRQVPEDQHPMPCNRMVVTYLPEGAHG
jgi:hypothetical protein